MGDQDKDKWDTDEMREHRNDWSLSADIKLLSHMHQFSQNLVSETHSTLKALDSLESEVANTTVEICNLGSRFWALSDTQFVESRVYDDDDVTSPTSDPSDHTKPSGDTEADIVKRLAESISEGVQVLNTKFETVHVPPSDSDDDDSSPQRSVLLKPVNRYKDRPLPHLIGTKEFQTDETLGLRDPPTDEETEEFISASEKGYEDSEDSDIESEQTKISSIEQNSSENMFSPVIRRSLDVGATLTKIPEPSGSIFEDEVDLFSPQTGKKSLFGNWQSVDLWADDDSQKLDDNSGAVRPPSSESSVSAHSSNVSEPVKKPSQDFGKSGSGRMTVSVQDDSDDLFGVSPEPAQIPPTKKSIPTGGVKIFGADFNPFPVATQKEVNKLSDESLQKEDRFVNNGKQILSKTQNDPDQDWSRPTSVDKKDDLFGDDDSDSDLFSSSKKQSADFRHKQNNTKSENSTVIKNLPNNHLNPLSDDIFPSKSDYDDLFSNKEVLPKNKSEQNHTIHYLQSSDSDDDLFSGIKKSTNKFSSLEKSNEDLFSTTKPMDKQVSFENKSKLGTSKGFGLFNQDLPSDDEDLFAGVGASAKSISGTPSLLKDAVAKINQQASNTPGTFGWSKNFFDDDDDDDLFPEVSLKKHSQENGDLFKSTKQEEDLKPSPRKLNKTELKTSLFESDSDEDLFFTNKDSNKSKKSSLLNTQNQQQKYNQSLENQSSTLKSEKIEADPPNTGLNIIDYISTDISSGSSNFLGEDEDLFSSSDNDKIMDHVNTPDLFNNTTTVFKAPVDSIQSSYKNDNRPLDNPSQQKTLNAVLDTIRKKHSSPDSDSSRTDKTGTTDGELKYKSENTEKTKLVPPKSLDVKSVIENIPQTKEKIDIPENIPKPPVAKKPVTKDSTVSKDAPDGEILPTAKVMPGKLKVSPMLKINPAALLPGARPKSKKDESPSPPNSEPPTITSSSNVDFNSSSDTQEKDMPPKGTLLQSVVKERPKIQGKRRPSSRRARQQAIKASSDENEENTSSVTASSSTLMSPSTDEEDLFSVPPLDIITDDIKALSPSTDIFGPPKVISPTKILPSSFVSTPLFHAQPPPLEEEEDDASSSQEKYLFEPQKLESLPDSGNNASSKRSSIDPGKNVGTAKDSNFDSLFADLEKEKPPPLMDEDDDNNSDELFVPSNKQTKHLPVLIDHSISTHSDPELHSDSSSYKQIKHSPVLVDHSISTHSEPELDLWSDKKPKLASHSTSTNSEPSIFQNNLKPPNLPILSDQEENSLFLSDDDLFTTHAKPSLFNKQPKSSEPQLPHMTTEDPLLNTKRLDSKNVQGSLFIDSEVNNQYIFDLPDVQPKDSQFSPLDQLFEPQPTVPSISSTCEGPDGIFTMHNNSKVSGSSDSMNASHGYTTVKTKDNLKNSLFGDLDDDEDLFSPKVTTMEKVTVKEKAKSSPLNSNLKTSLFPEDDDDYDLFASSTRKNTVPPTSKAETLAKHSTEDEEKTSKSKVTKAGPIGSSKPVKLQAKQAFSDPLFSLEDNSDP